MIEKIRKHVEEQCKKKTNFFTMAAYTHHFVPTVKYAKELAKRTGADKEIVEIAAWLHDIGSINGDYENHHIFGVGYAEKLLKKFNYPKEKIEKVKHCILTHRGSKKVPRETIEAECVASADAMSNFDDISAMFNLALVIHKKNIDESREFVKKKLQRYWDKLIPEAKEIIKPKYEAVILLLE